MENKKPVTRAKEYLETTAAGEDIYPGLPIVCLCGNLIYNQPHWHDHLEIVLCLKGTITISVEDELYQLSAGDYVTINRCERHEILYASPDGLQIFCSIRPECLVGNGWQHFLLSTVGGNAVPRECLDSCRLIQALASITYMQVPVLPAAVLRDYEHIGEKLRAMPEDPSFVQDAVKWHTYNIYAHMILLLLAKHADQRGDASQTSNSRSGHDDTFKKVIRYLNAHYMEPVKADMLAKQFHISVSTLYRLFKENLDEPLALYLDRLRVLSACNYLHEPNADIADIAFLCGFTSISNFYRVFRDIIGMSPRQYKQQTASHLSGNTAGSPPLPKAASAEIMKYNIFHPIHELTYTREDILRFARELCKNADTAWEVLSLATP